MNKKSKTYALMDKRQDGGIRLVIEGICVGILSGIVVLLYRFLLEEADKLRNELFSYIKSLNSYWPTILLFIGLAVIGCILGILIKKEPMISGSGIPQVKGVLLKQMKMNWLRVVGAKLLGGTLAIGAGLSLGREGPSIQIGAAMGQGFSRTLKRSKLEEKFLITSGASAGLSAAFSAPLAGVIFVLEELHKNFSPRILTTAMAASVTANFITQNLFGQKPVFNFGGIAPLPLNSYLYVIILGVVIGILGALFNWSLIKTQDLYEKQNWLPIEFRPLIPLMAAGILGFILPEALGGGHGLVMSLHDGGFTLSLLVLILAVKFLFTMLSYGSGVPGGIFLPLLSIGALAGCIYGNILFNFVHIDPSYINNFIILAMAGYFAAIVKAPVTGIVLITEMVGSFTHLLALTIVSMVAYIVTDILKSSPVYDLLFERILVKKGRTAFLGSEREKSILEVAVTLGSTMDGKMVKNIKWPAKCLLVAIRRGEREIIPKGNTVVYSGDFLVLLADEDIVAESKLNLLKMAGVS